MIVCPWRLEGREDPHCMQMKRPGRWSRQLVPNCEQLVPTHQHAPTTVHVPWASMNHQGMTLAVMVQTERVLCKRNAVPISAPRLHIEQHAPWYDCRVDIIVRKGRRPPWRECPQ